MMYVCPLVVHLLQIGWRHVNNGMKRLVIGGDNVTRRVGVRGRRERW